MAEGRDPEAVKDLLDDCFGVLVPVIEAHGGTVDKIIGDELMAVWGAPRAHEDDPERAVRAALALLGALERLDPSLEMRVGINTGEVLAGPVGPGGAYTVTGDTVNTAHRLVGVAARGAVLVGERTHAATVDAIAYAEPTAHALRGKREPVVAYPAVRVRHRPGERVAAGATTPMLGRDPELGQLVAAANAAVATGTPGLAVVVGEAGVGKTRLVSELDPTLQRVGSAATWPASCAPRTATTAPWSRWPPSSGSSSGWRRGSRTARSARPRSPGSSASPPRSSGSAATWRTACCSCSGWGNDGVGPCRRARSATACPRSCGRRRRWWWRRPPSSGRSSPWWTTPTSPIRPCSMPSTDSAADGRGSLLVVLVGREELLEVRPALGDASPRRLVLPLGPLGDGASHELLHRTLAQLDGHTGTLAATAEQQILRAAGGNPLLLDQLVRFLRETGALEVVEGGWRAARDLDEVGLPDDARVLLGARLDALPADERAALQAAAIVGRTFRLPALDGDGGAGRRRPPRSGGGPGPPRATRRFRRRPALVLPPPHGPGGGLRVGPARRSSGRPRQGPPLAPRRHRRPDEPDPAEVASHTERAVGLWKEVGHAPGVLPSGARPSLVAAARAARERDDLREADRWYQRALDLDLVEADDRIAVCLEHGSTLISLRRIQRPGRCFERWWRRTSRTRRPGRGPHRARRRRSAPGRRRRRGGGVRDGPPGVVARR